jgi:multimeric flavodoxin WrbA
MTTPGPRYDDLSALYVNCTLNPSPQLSHTQGLIDVSAGIMRKQGVRVEMIRAADHDIATGVWPDMTEHGAAADAWPQLYPKVLAAGILVIAGPIWLGDNSSVTKRVIERLYSCSHLLNGAGQYAYYGRVGGCLITGNEDGVKHCAMNILYSLQHLGYVIPPQADAGWIGEAGPGGLSLGKTGRVARRLAATGCRGRIAEDNECVQRPALLTAARQRPPRCGRWPARLSALAAKVPGVLWRAPGCAVADARTAICSAAAMRSLNLHPGAGALHETRRAARWKRH